MKAAVYIKGKSGKRVEVLDLPIPVPKEHEVLVKIRAASVNPLDWRLKSRRPGVDVAGGVEAVGSRVVNFKRGDEVFGMARGAFAEFACASESRLVLKPASISFAQAASIPIAGLTALQALRDVGHLKPTHNVLINGAAGGVGTFAVQLAKSMGARVTGVCSTRNLEQVRSLGADRVIDYTRDDFTTDDDCFDLVVDNVGNRPLPAMGRVLVPHGKCVLVGAPKTIGTVLARVLEAVIRRRFTFFVARMKKEDLEFLCSLIQTGQLTPEIDKYFALSEIEGAIAYVETGHARGKVIINVEP